MTHSMTSKGLKDEGFYFLEVRLHFVFFRKTVIFLRVDVMLPQSLLN